MSKANVTKQWVNNIDFLQIFKTLYRATLQPAVEVINGRKNGVLPIEKCLLASCFFQLLFILKFDFWLFKVIGLDAIYPINLYLRFIYVGVVVFSGFWCWGFIQMILQQKLTKKLTTVFTDAGLKSASGRIPSFIFDKPIDSETRHLKLKKNGASLTKWKEVSEVLESDLQIFIDHFEENRADGTIEIYYAHRPLQNVYEFPWLDFIGKDEFHVGTTRSKGVTTTFSECPHFLVGGQTDFGKSHFLNQAITTLYLKNKNYTFELIDLKFGSEFGLLFPNLPRINISESTEQAGLVLGNIANKIIEERAQFLKFNKCQNIGDLHDLPAKELKIPPHSRIKRKFGRMIIVMDEAFDLFLKNERSEASQAATARQNVIKIAAQGRFVGIHIMLGTQRPDGKAIDPLIKANLPGKICFPTSNNASSMTILDNGRGSQLPPIKGRCIWKMGSEMTEVQAPYLPKEKIYEMLDSYRVEVDAAEEQQNSDLTATKNQWKVDQNRSSKDDKDFALSNSDGGER